jgi:hypothetical protein
MATSPAAVSGGRVAIRMAVGPLARAAGPPPMFLRQFLRSRPELLVQRMKLLLQLLQLLVRELLHVHQLIPCPLHSTDQFIELEMNRLGIAVLGVLDQKDHEKGHNGRARINHQLPGIREAEEGAGHGPDEDDAESEEKCPGRAHGFRRDMCELAEEFLQSVSLRELPPPNAAVGSTHLFQTSYRFLAKSTSSLLPVPGGCHWIRLLA